MLGGAAVVRGCARPASFRLRSGGAPRGGRGAGCGTGGRRSGPGRARRPGFRAPPRELQLRRGGPPQPRLPPWGAPVISAPHTGKWRKARCERPGCWGGEGAPASAPRVPREPCPASRHFLSENGARRRGRRRRRSGRASSRAGSCCLPARWGRALALPPGGGGERPRTGGRRVHASGHVWAATRPRRQGGPHAGWRRAGGTPAERPGTGAVLTMAG